MAFAPLAAALTPSARVFVASTGSDSNDGGRLSPKRSFQSAHDAVAAGGEIVVVDSAGYGALSVTKSVSVIADGSLAASTSITVNAPNGNVVLRGLTIDGGGSIYVLSAATVSIEKCVVQNAAGDGINIYPLQQIRPTISISDVTILNSGGAGIGFHQETANLIVERATLKFNQVGFSGDFFGAGAPMGDRYITIKNTIAAYNTNQGFYFNGIGLRLFLDGLSSFKNGGSGVQAGCLSDVGCNGLIIGRSTIYDNAGNGVYVETGPAVTFGGNLVFNNNGSFGDTRLYPTITLQ